MSYEVIAHHKVSRHNKSTKTRMLSALAVALCFSGNAQTGCTCSIFYAHHADLARRHHAVGLKSARLRWIAAVSNCNFSDPATILFSCDKVAPAPSHRRFGSIPLFARQQQVILPDIKQRLSLPSHQLTKLQRILPTPPFPALTTSAGRLQSGRRQEAHYP